MKIYKLSELDDEYRKNVEKYKDKFDNILSFMHLEVFEPDENIISFNHKLRKLRFLISGNAKITVVHEDGKKSIVHFVDPEEFIGELTLLGIEAQHKDVVAIKQCVCLSLYIEDHKDMLLADAEFLLMLSRYIGTKLLKRTWFTMKSQNYDFKNVLAAYILMTECDGVYKEKHTETSEFLAVSYRHLLHTLKEFREDGLITKLSKGYKIDKTSLEILAKDIR